MAPVKSNKHLNRSRLRYQTDVFYNCKEMYHSDLFEHLRNEY
uniref:Uncharacterized protein n=1 Tax=Heterorhabditis bacteriophora TaxID=37862 RepID=A0A1I7WFR9_HETBA